MYTKEGHSGMFQRRMERRAAFWGGELFVHRCAIARHSLLVVGAGLRAPTIRRLFGGGRTEEQPRSALRLFFASRFARLRGIACWGSGRVAGSNHSPPVRRRGVQRSLGAPAVFCIALCAIARHSLLVVGQGCGLQPFAACSAAGEQRNILARRSGCFLHRALRDCAA